MTGTVDDACGGALAVVEGETAPVQEAVSSANTTVDSAPTKLRMFATTVAPGASGCGTDTVGQTL